MQTIDLVLTLACVLFPTTGIIYVIFTNMRIERQLDQLAEKLLGDE